LWEPIHDEKPFEPLFPKMGRVRKRGFPSTRFFGPKEINDEINAFSREKGEGMEDVVEGGLGANVEAAMGTDDLTPETPRVIPSRRLRLLVREIRLEAIERLLGFDRLRRWARSAARCRP